MGIAEVAVFAICWVIVVSIMLWGVLTEGRRIRLTAGTGRGWRRRRRIGSLGPEAASLHPTRYRAAPTDWIVVESMPGTGAEVGNQAHMIAAALLASRGIDIESLPAGDIRTEVTTAGDGQGTTRILVRAGALHASRRRR